MSNLLEQASLVMIPSGYKEDVVYSVIPTSGAGDLTFTRASNGTRIDSNGNVEVVPWNLIQYSEYLSSGFWNKNNNVGSAPVVTSNDTTAPNGTLTADKIVFSNGAGGAINGVYQYFTRFEGARTASVWLKSASGTPTIYITTQDDTTGGNYTTCVLSTEWQRFEVTYTTAAINAQSILIGYYPGAGTPSGPSGSLTIYAWGAQLNIGSTAKPYFPTTDRLNVPRLTYQNGGGGCPSLLLEKQSTNLVTYSEQFDNAAWSNASSSVTANNTTSPDGTQNADLITFTSTTYASIYQAATTTNGTTYTASVYAKKGNQNFLGLEIRGASSSTDTVFNLNTGVVVSGTGTIESVGNGWYRCTITKAANNTSTLLIIGRGDSGANNDTVYLWGAQLEASSYPTSYIPTTSSSATRVADACYKTGISSLIGQTQGTFFVDVDIINPVTPNGNWHILMVGSASERITIYTSGTSTINTDGNGSGGGFAPISGALTFGRNKIAVGYANNDVAFYVNGTLIGTRTTATIPSSMSQVDVGGNYTYANYIGSNTYNEVVFFPTRLTNSELAQLTGNQNYTINQAYESYGVASESPNCVQP